MRDFTIMQKREIVRRTARPLRKRWCSKRPKRQTLGACALVTAAAWCRFGVESMFIKGFCRVSLLSHVSNQAADRGLTGAT